MRFFYLNKVINKYERTKILDIQPRKDSIEILFDFLNKI